MKRPDEKNYSYNLEIYESYSYCRDMVKYANALEAQIKALKKVTLGLPSVSDCYTAEDVVNAYNRGMASLLDGNGHGEEANEYMVRVHNKH